MSQIDSYFARLSGWQMVQMTKLRRTILAVSGVTEMLKWGHPVYDAGAPVCLLKSHKTHIAFGFFRGALLLDIDNRLTPHGGFEMATIRLEDGANIDAGAVRRLVIAAIALNRD